jgi:hypothetical protein
MKLTDFKSRILATKISYIILFSLVGLYISISHGIDLEGHFVYNFLEYDFYVNPEKFYDSLIGLQQAAIGTRFFTILTGEILQQPLYFLILAISLKIIIIFITYLNLHIFLTDKKSLLLTILVSISIGFPLEAISKELLFDRKTLSIFLLLLGFYKVLSHRSISGFISLSLAVFLHPLTGATSVVFFMAPVLLYFYKNNKNKFSSLIAKSVILIVPIAVLAYAKNYYSLPISENFISVADWYDFIARSEPDDAFMHIRLQENFLVAFLVVAFFLNNKKPNSTDLLHVIFNAQIAILTIIILIEIMHKNGIFFGKISEVFLVVEFRRGIWYVLLTSLIVIFRDINMDANNKKPHNIIFVILAIIFSNILLYDYAQIMSVFFASYIMWSSIDNVSKKKVTIFLIMMPLILIYFMYSYSYNYPEYYVTTTFNYLIFSLLLFIIYRIVKKYRDEFFASYTVIFLFCAIILVNNFYKNDIVLPKYFSLLNIQSNGNYYQQLKSHYLRNDNQRMEYQALASTDMHNKNFSTILFSPTMINGYYTDVIPNGRILFSRWDNTAILELMKKK